MVMRPVSGCEVASSHGWFRHVRIQGPRERIPIGLSPPGFRSLPNTSTRIEPVNDEYKQNSVPLSALLRSRDISWL